MPKPDPSQGITTTSSLGLPTGSEEEAIEALSKDDAEGVITYEDGKFVSAVVNPTDGEEDE